MRHDVRPFEPFAALRRLLTRKSRPPVATRDELADFLAAQTAYVAQRTVLEYCRARAGLNWDKLFGEQAFLDSLEVCRWEAYAALLADVAELALILLRRQSPADPQGYLPGIAEAARAALLRHPVPRHRASWDEACAAIEQHLAQSLLAAPRAVHLAGLHSADAIFGYLPIHPDLRREDREMFRNSVRFALCGVFDEVTRRLDVPLLETALQPRAGGRSIEPDEERRRQGVSGSTGWPDAIHAALGGLAVRQVAFVPDAGHSRLIELCQADPAMRAVVLTTEEEGVALLAGAWLGGERGVLLMQSSGVGNCVNMLALNQVCRLPLLMLVTMRGEWGEFNPWQLPMGQSVAPVLQLAGAVVQRLDQAEMAGETVQAAGRIAFEGQVPVAVLIGQRLIGAKSFLR